MENNSGKKANYFYVICSFLDNSPGLSSNCRRFGTHYPFHLHRQVNELCQWQDCAGYLYLVGLERGSGRANRKWCARAGRLEVQQVVEGEGVYKCVCTRTYIHPPLPAALLTAPHGHTTSYWLCHFPAPTQPGINTPHNPVTDILHSPAYEDGTDSEFRNVGN